MIVLPIEVVSYSICAIAFVFLAVLVSLSQAGARYKWLLAIAAGATALWAGSIAVSIVLGHGLTAALVLELVRTVAWLIFLSTVLGMRYEDPSRGVPRITRLVAAGSGIVGIGLVVGGYVAINVLGPGSAMKTLFTLVGVVLTLLAVIGLLILENLFRNADESGRWAIKHLCFGLGILFAYDFYLYADAALVYIVDQTLYQARGIVNALVVPLIAISASRYREWKIDIHVSRRVVFHSAALLGSGLYLVLMSAAGYYLREVGGRWGPTFQIIFFSGALLILLVIFSSGSVRARFRVWISKNFFSYSYDYREEWLRFTQTISLDDQGTGLHDRIIRAVADILESTGGALWARRDEDRAFLPSTELNLNEPGSPEILPAVPTEDPLIEFLDRTQWVVDVNQYRVDPDAYEGLEAPDWLIAHPRTLVIVPLVHGNSLRAFLVLASRRTNRPIDWETIDLHKAVARQAASYLAEEEAANALSDARRLDSFNRRFAFVVHDIENLVSQMSLMLQNAERYGDDPEFQKDMLATVGNTVIRMTSLLEQFKSETNEETPEPRLIQLNQLVSRVGENWRKQMPNLDVDLEAEDMRVVADHGSLASVFDHLLQNAIEACGADGHVALRLRRHEDDAVVEVEDDGPGMDAAFIRDHLFRPLRTEKADGYGLGAYQTRELVREFGGRLDVESAPGKGTKMRVVIPLATSPRLMPMNGTRGASN